MRRKLTAVGASAALTIGLCTLGAAVAPTAEAATVETCSDSTPVDNPDTGASDAKLGLAVAWQETETASGRVEARVNAGRNAIYLFDNHINTAAIYSWTLVGWTDWLDPLDYYGKATTGQGKVTVTDGQAKGVEVTTDGHVYQAPWVENTHRYWGYRQWVEYHDAHIPIARINLWSHQNGKTLASNVAVFAHAGPGCGQLILY